MAALSRIEIKDCATHFAKERAGTTREEADAKPFLIVFFNVFGLFPKRKNATADLPDATFVIILKQGARQDVVRFVKLAKR